MKLGSIDKTAAIAWSPGVHTPLLGLGTIAGAMDASFSTQTELEIYEFSLGKPLKKVGATTVNARFNTLAWGALTSKQQGLLAGGKENGELDLYDPAAILSGVKEPIARHALFSGPVKGLDFSTVNHSLLGAGGPDGEVLVFDLQSGAKPFRPAPKSNRIEDVSALSWNQIADYILAVGSNNGSTAVYDLRGKREIMKLSYPGGRKQVTGISWHPNTPTRIVTVNDDDNSPYVLTWDLRNASAPEQSFSGHEKGILSVSWCTRDPDLLLSTSKDNRTLLWDLSEGGSIGELCLSRNWVFDAIWCPRNPDIVAVASFDGTVSVHSLQGQGITEVETNTSSIEPSPAKHDPNDPFANLGNQHSRMESMGGFILSKPPKWLRRSVGASWAFGGKLVTFSGNKASIVVPNVEPNLMSRIEELDAVVKGDSFEGFKAFCDSMSRFQGEGEAFTDRDRETWKFLKVMFEKSRDHMLDFLGFSSDNALNDRLEKLEQKLAAVKLKEEETLAKLPLPSSFALYPTASSVKPQEEADIDSLITRHCIVGEFEKAVDICLSAGRLDDALVIAVSGGPELMQKTQKEYFRRRSGRKSYIRLLQSVVESNFDDVVKHVNIDEAGQGWKDVMAFVATFASSSELSRQFSSLASRMADECRSPDASKKAAVKALDPKKRDDKAHAAALCYIGAGDLEKAVDVWTRREIEEEKTLLKQSLAGSKLDTHVTALQSLMEKVTVLRKAINYIDPSLSQSPESAPEFPLDLLYSHLAEYAEILSGLGKLEGAWKSLEMIPGGFRNIETTEESVDPIIALRDRLYHSLGIHGKNVVAPAFPFNAVEIISKEELLQAEAKAKEEAAKSYQNGYQQQQPQQYQGTGGYGYSQSAYQQYNQAPSNGYVNGYTAQQGSYGSTGAYGYVNNNVPLVGGYQTPAGPQASYGYNQPQTPYMPPQQVNAPYGQASNAYGQPPQPMVPPPMNAPPPPKPDVFQPPMPSSYTPAPAATVQQPWMPPAPPTSASKPVPALPPAAPPVNNQPWVPPVPTMMKPQTPTPFVPPVMGGPPPMTSHQQPFQPPPAGTNFPPPSSAATQPPRSSMAAQEPTVASQEQPSPSTVQSAPPPSAEMPVEFKPIVDGFEKHMEVLKKSGEMTHQKRALEDAERRLKTLFEQLTNKQVPEDVVKSLEEILKGLEASDFAKASQVQIDLMTRRFDKTGMWIMGVKRMIDSLDKLKSSQNAPQSIVPSPTGAPQAMTPPPGPPRTPGPPDGIQGGPPRGNMGPSRGSVPGSPDLQGGPPRGNMGPPRGSTPNMLAGPPRGGMPQNHVNPQQGPPSQGYNRPPYQDQQRQMSMGDMGPPMRPGPPPMRPGYSDGAFQQSPPQRPPPMGGRPPMMYGPRPGAPFGQNPGPFQQRPPYGQGPPRPSNQ